MPIEGGRLNAHKARMKDFRIRKERKAEHKDKSSRFQKPSKVDFDTIDPRVTDKVIDEIRRKAKKDQNKLLLIILVSILITIGSLVLVRTYYFS